MTGRSSRSRIPPLVRRLARRAGRRIPEMDSDMPPISVRSESRGVTVREAARLQESLTFGSLHAPTSVSPKTPHRTLSTDSSAPARSKATLYGFAPLARTGKSLPSSSLRRPTVLTRWTWLRSSPLSPPNGSAGSPRAPLEGSERIDSSTAAPLGPQTPGAHPQRSRISCRSAATGM